MDSDEAVTDASVRTHERPEQRRPYWAVGLALLGVVIAVLAAAVLLDQRLRPRVGIEPVPTIAAAPTTAAAPTARAIPTATSAPVAAPERSTANTPLEREIEGAYQRYVQIYSEAVLNLDTSRLGEVLDGDALQLVTAEVNDRKVAGRPLKVIEDDRLIAIGPVTDTSGSLIDEYTSRSVTVDMVTKQPLPRTSPPTRIRQVYTFRKAIGTWKIVDGTREVLGEANR
jgi:hypothetical protein